MSATSFWRLVATNRGPGVFVFVFVLASVLLATIGPALLTSAFTDGIHYEVSANSTAVQRDLVGQTREAPAFGPSQNPAASGLAPDIDAVWGAQNDALDTIHAQLPDALRDATAPAVSTVVTDSVPLFHPEGAVRPDSALSLGADPRYTDRIRVTAGSLPAPYTPGGVIDMVLSTAAAAQVNWSIGDVRTLDFADGTTSDVRLSGTFDPLDAAERYWVHKPVFLEASIVRLPKITIYEVDGFTNPASWPALSQLHVASQTQAWFGVQTAQLTTATASAIATEARAFVSKQNALSLPFTTKLPASLEAAVQRNTVTERIIVMVAAGPAALLLAIFGVITAQWWRRRQPTWQLLNARGASARQGALVSAAESLVYSMPAAVVGWAAASVVGGWSRSGSGLVAAASAATVTTVFATLIVALVIALVPAVLFAAVATGHAVVTGHAVGAERFARPGAAKVTRVLGEVACLVLLAVAIVLTVQNGSDGVGR